MTQDDYLSLDNFKKWMRSQEKSKPPTTNNWHKTHVGITVESKLPAKRLALKIRVEEGEVVALSKDFAEHGGTVVDVDDKHFLVEVSQGTFFIHRGYVKKS